MVGNPAAQAATQCRAEPGDLFVSMYLSAHGWLTGSAELT
jgi:hypothetical protein